jgi:hypothetical protein
MSKVYMQVLVGILGGKIYFLEQQADVNKY